MFTYNICQNLINNKNKFITCCNHQFCNSCITHWLLLKDNCPMCRYNIIQKNIKHHKDDSYDDSDDSDDDTEFSDYYVQWPDTSNYLSFNELQDIRKKYRDDIYDMCDDMIDDINDNYLVNIDYNEKYNFYETEEEIDTKQKIIYIIIKYFPDSEEMKIKFIFKK